MDSIDRLEDEEKSSATDIKGHKSGSSDFTEPLSGIEERLDNVTKSVDELDASVESTNIRQHEHSEFVAVTANNAATSKLLVLAIDRLFYAPAFHKAAPKAELSGESASGRTRSRRLRDSMIPKRLVSQA